MSVAKVDSRPLSPDASQLDPLPFAGRQGFSSYPWALFPSWRTFGHLRVHVKPGRGAP